MIFISVIKVCGFLTEMVANYAVEAIICGIGINMNHTEDDFIEEIKSRATSIRLHATHKINRYAFLISLSHKLFIAINSSYSHLIPSVMNISKHLTFGSVK